MNQTHCLLAVIVAACAAGATAGEHKVEQKPFTATVSLDATFLPDHVHPLMIDADAWTDFRILELVEQGGTVHKGQAVVVLDTEDIDRDLSDDADATKLRKMALAAAERELANLEVATPWNLDAAKRTYDRAKDDLAYNKKVAWPLEEERSRRSVEKSKQSLEYATEELKQLLKMYEEDDLTEETEEIILKRQRIAVDSADFSFKSARITAKRVDETFMPRRKHDAEVAFRRATQAWKTARESLPRDLAQKRLEVKKLRIDDKRADEKSAELKKDRERMNAKSEVDGLVYHGEIKNGKWTPATVVKFLKEGGKIPPRTVFATVIPRKAGLQLDAFAQESVVARLKPGQKGYVAPAAAPRSRIPVTVGPVGAHPGVDGKYHVVLKTQGKAAGLQIVPGMKGKVKISIAPEMDAITIPIKALKDEADGSYTVRVKSGEETASRPVTVGVESNGSIEILTGLEAGEIVMTPNAPAPKPAAKPEPKK